MSLAVVSLALLAVMGGTMLGWPAGAAPERRGGSDGVSPSGADGPGRPGASGGGPAGAAPGRDELRRRGVEGSSIGPPVVCPDCHGAGEWNPRGPIPSRDPAEDRTCSRCGGEGTLGDI